MENLQVIIASHLKELRESKGYTKAFIGKYLKMSPEGYGYYESDKRTPGPEIIKSLSKLYDVTTDYILGVWDGDFADSATQNQKKEAPAITAEALKKIAEEETGRPLTDAELLLLSTRVDDLVATLDDITKKKD